MTQNDVEITVAEPNGTSQMSFHATGTLSGWQLPDEGLTERDFLAVLGQESPRVTLSEPDEGE